MMRPPIRSAGFAMVSQCLLLGIGSVAAEVTEHHADTDGALGVARGAANAEIRAALTAKTQNCTGMNFQPQRCALADNALNADVHYGSGHSQSRKFALVSVRWQSDPTGNAVEVKGLVFVADEGARFRLLGATDLIGDRVSDVVFEAQRITYATAYLRAGDSRSQSSGRRRYEIPLGATGIGPVAIQRTGFTATAGAAPPPPIDDALLVVKRLYEAGPGYEAIFNAKGAASPVLSPGLVAVNRKAAALSRRCMIYDGDPRLGGAQGAGGPADMRYEERPVAEQAGRRAIRVRAAQVEEPAVITNSTIVLIRTERGWRVDDLIPDGAPGYRAAIAAASAGCRPSQSR